MKRKTFIKASAALATGSIIIPNIISCKSNAKPAATTEAITTPVVIRKNWAKNYQYKAKQLLSPSSVDELVTMVKNNKISKALGSTHCFNDIADSPEVQISTANLNKVISIDEANKTCTVESGVRYGQFAPELQQKNLALHNLASLPHISVAGACATATHGSGVENGNLATSVRAIELVTANGEVKDYSRDKDGDLFNGVVVHLGAMGIVTKVTLDLQKTFDVRQDLFQDLPLESLKHHFDEIMSSGYSVSLFTDWLNKKVSQIWIKRRMDQPIKHLGKNFFGATAATKNLHPIVTLSAENCTEQMGVPGPWYERLPHFKMGFTPSSGEELQAEFFVPRKNAVDAILALEKKGEQINKELMITEIRTIAADNLWMSTAYQQDSVAIHFTLKQHTPEVLALLPVIQNELAPFGARPHWGKLFTITRETLVSRYPKWNEFAGLVKTLDPGRKWKNEYLDRVGL